MQVPLICHGEERETSFRLGVGRSTKDVQILIRRFRRADASRTALEGVWNYWNRTLGDYRPSPASRVRALFPHPHQNLSVTSDNGLAMIVPAILCDTARLQADVRRAEQALGADVVHINFEIGSDAMGRIPYSLTSC